MNQSLIQLIWQTRRIAIVLTDQRLVIRELHGLSEIIGVEKKKWVGCSLLEIFPELIGAEQDLADILAGKLSSLKLEYVNRETAQGKTCYMTLEDLPHRDEDGTIIGIAHLVQDVTSKGELERQVTQNRNEMRILKEQVDHQNLELVAANKELRRLSELKSQFISVAAHELRTPLTSLIGYVEMLADGLVGPLTVEQREVLEVVEKSGQRLITLTDKLLNAARLEAGRVDLVLKPVDLVRLVKEVISEHAIQTRSKSQSLNLEFPPDLPQALCDENWTKLIVTNLLSNASKFTPENGSIYVRVQLAGQPGYLQLSVVDTGVGIPKQDQAKIFSRWFRARNTSVLNAQGSGLGLYITHALVELHNGSIRIESHPKQGSVFHVTFPIAS